MYCSHLLLVEAVLEENEGGVRGSILVVGKAQRGLGVHGLAKEAADSTHLTSAPTSMHACMVIPWCLTRNHERLQSNNRAQPNQIWQIHIHR